MMRTSGLANLYRQIEKGEVDVLKVPSSGATGETGTFLYLNHGANGVHRELEVDRQGVKTVRDAVPLLGATGHERPRYAMGYVQPPTTEVRHERDDYVAVTEVCADCGSGVLADPLVHKGTCGTCGRERR